ncbi:hypothetical protein D3C73_1571180 [compost metagenome]
MYIKSGYSPATQITVNGQPVTDGKSTSRILLKLDDGTSTEGSDTTGDAGTGGTQDAGTGGTQDAGTTTGQ